MAINNPFKNAGGLTFEDMMGSGSKEESSVNDMAARMAKDFAIGKIKESYEENKGWLSLLSFDGYKVYFDVTNTYVLHKLKLTLLPFLVKDEDWRRGFSAVPGQGETVYGAMGSDGQDE